MVDLPAGRHYSARPCVNALRSQPGRADLRAREKGRVSGCKRRPFGVRFTAFRVIKDDLLHDRSHTLRSHGFAIRVSLVSEFVIRRFITYINFLSDYERLVFVAQFIVFQAVVSGGHHRRALLHVAVAALLVALVVQALARVKQSYALHGLAAQAAL